VPDYANVLAKVIFILGVINRVPAAIHEHNVIAYSAVNGNGNGLLFHMTQPISRSTIKAIACSKPTISEH